MSKAGKIIKDTYRTKKESVLGKSNDSPYTDPMEPWSAKANSPIKEEVEELAEDSVLYRYIRSKGYSPEHMDFAHRSAFARSRAFKAYKIMHQKKKDRQATGGIHDIKAVRKEEVELTEAGVGGLMNFIRSKGLDPTSMDGNHKKHYSRSSEYRVFKTVQPNMDEAKAKFKEREKAKEDKKKPKKVNETSGMGERGDDWNEEITPAAPKAKKPYTHEVFHIKSGKVTGRYTSRNTAYRGADKKDNEYGGYAYGVRPVKEAVDEKDEVTMDIPLLIRVLEYAREDAKTDMDLHKVVENLINMRGQGCLSMDMYNKIVSIKEAIEEADEAKYGKDYQAMVLRVGEKAKKKPVDMKSLAARMQASYKKGGKQLKELKKQDDNQEMDAHITREEVEELSELSKTTLKSYIKGRGETIQADKAESNVARNRAADLEYRGKQAQADTNHDEADALHQRARKGATNVTKAAIKVAKKNEEVELTQEGVVDAAKSAWKAISNFDDPTPKYDGNTEGRKRQEKRRQAAKSARMIKSLYKNKLKESTYDWEKDDKGSKKTTAKITVKGGTTMTGKTRDTVEIEPVLKTRPNGANGLKPGV